MLTSAEISFFGIFSGLCWESPNFPPKVELVLEIGRNPQHQRLESHSEQVSVLPGTPYCRGRLGTVGLLVTIACFVKKSFFKPS